MSAPPVTSSSRPSRPRPSPTRYVAVLGVAALSWLAASDATGIGLVERIQRTFRDGVPDRTQEIIGQVFSPAWEDFGATVDPFFDTLAMAVLGTLFGCSLALLFAFGASAITAGGAKRMGVTKSVMSVIRSVPDVMWALIFVSAVGSGTVSGLLALVLFNIGVVSKLLSETIDAVDTGPLEAADASGAGLVSRARAAVFPQVLPNYLAFSIYAFELNVRASAVLGLVGAGGIGTLLNLARTQFRYDRVSLIVVEIFVFVFIAETISVYLRRRLVK